MKHLKYHGFEPVVQDQVSFHWFTFPGEDIERAEALYELASDPQIQILWAARGGYGATRLLPLLDQLSEERGNPPANKLLLGYSDVTVLHEYVRSRWHWHTLHAPMPAASNFPKLAPREWQAIVDYVRGRQADSPWAHERLHWLSPPPSGSIAAELIGGNLSLWAALAGTKYIQAAHGKILFLEDIGEAFYRIDRMLTQLEQCGLLDGAAAIVLGDFTDCKDENNTCLAHPNSPERKPLRKVFGQEEAFKIIFGHLSQRLGVPLARGLPVGHGPNFAPLPLGGQYELTPGGQLSLRHWDWLSSRHSHSSE